VKQSVPNLSTGSEQTYISRCHCWLPSWEILLGEPIENCKTNKLLKEWTTNMVNSMVY